MKTNKALSAAWRGVQAEKVRAEKKAKALSERAQKEIDAAQLIIDLAESVGAKHGIVNIKREHYGLIDLEYYGETKRREAQDKAGGAAFARLAAKVKAEAPK